MLTKSNKIIPLALSFLLIFEQSGFAQVETQNFASLYLSTHLASFHNTLSTDTFRPLHLRYMQYSPEENNFKLLLDKGDFVKNNINEGRGTKDEGRKKEKIEQETNKLMEYFFIGLALPNESFWVNLRPDSPDNVIDNYLCQTDIGRVMLETDVYLKKDTARWTSPKTPEGRQYWDKLYKKAEELFGNENVTIPTLTRLWIVPGEIIIRETIDEGRGMKDEGRKTNPSVYIYKATLKVMLEEDYLESQNAKCKSQNYNSKFKNNQNNEEQITDIRLKQLNTYSTQLIKELIIPKLTKEINTSKRYAALRQVYYSLILAQWFKSRVSLRGASATKQSFINLINSSNLAGLTSKTFWSKDTYYKEYQKSFKDGEYNIQEPVYTPTGQVIRSYFSGGESLVKMAASSSGIFENGIASIQSVGLPAVNSFTKESLIEMVYDGNVVSSGIDNDINLIETDIDVKSKIDLVTNEWSNKEVFGQEFKKFVERYFPEAEFDPWFYGEKLSFQKFYNQYCNSEENTKKALLRLWELYNKYLPMVKEINDRIKNILMRDYVYIEKIIFDMAEINSPFFNRVYRIGGAIKLGINLPYLFDKRKDIFGIGVIAHEAGHGLTRFIDNSMPDLLEGPALKEEMSANYAAAKILSVDEAKDSLVQQIKLRQELQIWNKNDAEYLLAFAKALGFFEEFEIMLKGFYNKTDFDRIDEYYQGFYLGAVHGCLVRDRIADFESADLSNLDNFKKANNIGHNDFVILAPNLFLNKDKGAEDLILAIEEIAGKGFRRVLNKIGEFVGIQRKIKVVIIGEVLDQDLLLFLQTHIDIQNLKKNFIFKQSVPQEELRNWYTAADIIALPSKNEGFGLVLREGALMGKAAIAYDAPGVNEAIANGKTGILVPWDDNVFVRAKNLAGGIRRLLTDSKLRISMGINARDSAISQFDLNESFKKYVEAYKKIPEVAISLHGKSFSAANNIPIKILFADSEPLIMSDRIFDNDNFLRAVDIQRPTVVFDLDDTLIPRDDSFSLRPRIVEQLKTLKGKGIRLVIWSAAARERVELCLQRLPEIREYFDFIIVRENYENMTADEISNAYILIDYSVPDQESMKNFLRSRNGYYKDISILGKQVIIVDDDPFLEGDNKRYPGNKFPSITILPISLLSELDPEDKKVESLADTILKLLAMSSSVVNSEHIEATVRGTNAPGGIDFRSLPIVTQAMTNLSANISSSAINRLSSVNLNTEWQGIERMALSGIKVSPERLKEYVQAGCVKGNIIQIRDKIILYISDLLRQEEELCVETDSLLRDILVMLESIRDSRKLKEVFLGEAIPVKG